MDITEIGNLGSLSDGEPMNLDKWLLICFSQFVFWCCFSIAAAQIFLGLSLLLYIGISFKQKKFKIDSEYHSLIYLILVFILWEAIASIVGERPIRSLIDLRGEWLFFAIPITIYLCKKRGVKERLLISLTSGILILSIYAIVQSFTGIDFPTGFLRNENSYRLVGFFSHALTFGNFIATAAIFLTAFTVFKFSDMTYRNKLFFSATSILSVVATFLSNSRGPLLALIIGLLILGILFRKFRYPLIILIALSISLILIFPDFLNGQINRSKKDLNTSDPHSRILIWKTSLKIIKANPVFGVGQSNFGDEYDLALPGNNRNIRYRKGHAHNDLLHIAATSGIPALLLYLSIWILIFKKIWRRYLSEDKGSMSQALKFGALLASIVFLAASMTESVFADEEVRHLLMFIWGIGLASIEVSQSYKDEIAQ